jgi:hypothetical protein
MEDVVNLDGLWTSLLTGLSITEWSDSPLSYKLRIFENFQGPSFYIINVASRDKGAFRLVEIEKASLVDARLEACQVGGLIHFQLNLRSLS